MAIQSAGILLYRPTGDTFEVLLGHPGGPYFAKKDDGVWSIPKGEFGDDEDSLQAAKREFKEETGTKLGSKEFEPLGTVKLPGGKIIHAWAAQGDLDSASIKSNKFSMEWPPKSGRQQEFPEIDRAEWFGLSEAAKKLGKNQIVFLERLALLLKIDIVPEQFEAAEHPKIPEQPSLF